MSHANCIVSLAAHSITVAHVVKKYVFLFPLQTKKNQTQPSCVVIIISIITILSQKQQYPNILVQKQCASALFVKKTKTKRGEEPTPWKNFKKIY